MAILFEKESYAIIGAAIEVYNTLGAGFLEAVYQEALALEFQSRRIPFEAQKRLRIFYKEQPLQKEYIADFVCFDTIIIEIKALKSLSGTEDSQILNYLKATNLRCGIIINFGNPKELERKRFVH